MLAAGSPRPALAKGDLLFFDPDANHQALLRINADFNRFLKSQQIDLAFRPLTSLKTFTQLIGNNNARFAIVSPDYLRSSGGHGLKPLLVPAADGEAFYQKVLVTVGDQSSDQSGKTIAATIAVENSAAATASLSKTLRQAGVKVDGTRYLRMSKDVDALLAMAFRRADAAIVTPGSIEILEKINPTLAKSFRVIAKTNKKLRPPLCVFSARTGSAETKKVVAAFKKMADHPDGRKAMSTLWFNGWIPYKPWMLAAHGERGTP